MYKVIGGVKSRTLRVLWMLEELGVAYRHIDVGPRTEEVLAVNPAGKIPVLIDGETALTDSAAIIQYLADKHGQFTFPAGTLERARQDGLTHLILDELDAVLWTAARHSFVLPEGKRVPEVKDSLKWEFARNLQALSKRIKGPFLMGEKMTVPDIILTHCGRWAEVAGFPLDDPKFKDYMDRMQSRDAFTRAVTQ